MKSNKNELEQEACFKEDNQPHDYDLTDNLKDHLELYIKFKIQLCKTIEV